MTAIFVSATGTDVGKTFVTAGLIRELRHQGRPVVHTLKPVISGFDPNAIGASDTGVILDALGLEPTPDIVAGISPWRFAAPLSPDMAARREGRTVDFDALISFCRDGIATTHGTLLIEGVGGIMVPLDNDRTVLDWMMALGLPVLLVAGSYLGTISHTLSALDVLNRHGLSVISVVISESPASPVDLEETASTIRRFADCDVLTLPRLNAPDHPAFAALAARL
jgi:dethiobiotin synthetase